MSYFFDLFDTLTWPQAAVCIVAMLIACAIVYKDP